MSAVYVLPVGAVDKVWLDFVRRKIEMKFGCSSEVLKEITIPEHAYDVERGQYSSTQILKNVLEAAPDDATKIIGITDVDLHIPVLTFVFGQAQLNGRAGVVSVHRLRQEYYGLPPNSNMLLKRLVKEVMHELGHTFGMIHCRDRRCAMYFSNSIREIDTKDDTFCRSCSRVLSSKL